MIAFGSFRLDVEAEQLWKGSELVTLRRKPFAILRYLVANPRRLVTHDELIQNVWGAVTVGDSAIRTHLHELRQVLGEGLIETVIGRGYRFNADCNAAQPEAVPRAAASDRVIVGRDAELATLRAAFARAEGGHRQICFVTGNPGIGKTSLVDAFLDELSTSGVTCARGQCIEQFGAPEAYLALFGALRELRGSARGAEVLAALIKHGPTVVSRMPQLAPDDQLDAAAKRSQGAGEARLVRELIDTLEVLASRHTLVLLLEDMQWSDMATIDLLANLGQRRERARLLVIVTARSADVRVAQHPLNPVMRTLVARHGATAIAVDRVASADLARYIDVRFPQHAFPLALAEVVERITEGTPLYMVSLLDDLIARDVIVARDGVWTLATTLEDVIARRTESVRQLIDIQLDRLAPDEQRLLEAASMLGIELSVALVAAALGVSAEAVDDTCDALARRGLFLLRAGTDEWPDGTAHARYRMTHALVQEVVHARCSLARRQRWHRAIAECLERAWSGRTSEVAHALALHYDRAAAPAQAVPHYIEAAEDDARRYATANALALLRRARELIVQVPASRDRDRDALRILQGLSASLLRSSSAVAREPIAMFEEMTQLAERIDDKTALVAALANVVMRLCTLAEYARAGEVMAHLDQVCAANPLDDELRTFVEVARGLLVYWRGDSRAALPVLEALARKYGKATGPKFGVVSPTDQATIMRTYLSYLRFILGDADGMRVEAEGLLDDARRTGDPYGIGIALCAVSRMHVVLGHGAAEIRGPATEALALPGAEPVAPVARLLLACAAAREHPLDEAAARAAFESFSARTTMYPMGKTFLALLVVDAVRGSAASEAAALELVEQMIAFAREQDERLVEPELVRVRGELREATDPRAAADDYREALALARAAGAVGFEQRAAASLSRLD